MSLPKNVIYTCVPVCALGDTVAAGTVPDVSINLCVDELSTFKLCLAKAWSLLSFCIQLPYKQCDNQFICIHNNLSSTVLHVHTIKQHQ